MRREPAPVEITQVIRRRGRTSPPSLRAEILLVASAFLCGAVLTGLLFVGIWRHTAVAGDRAEARQAVAQRAAVSAHHRLAALGNRLDQEHTRLVAAQTTASEARRKLAAQNATLTTMNRTLPPRLAAAQASVQTILTKVSALRSELAALEGYVRNPGATGVDPGYLLNQARYLSAAADSAATAAAAAARESEAAVAAVAVAGKN